MINRSHSRHTWELLARVACFAVCVNSSAAFCWAQPAPVRLTERPWLDGSLGTDDRIEGLLAAMTLEEKIGQLRQTNGIGGEPTGDPRSRVADSALYELVRSGRLGSILNEIHPGTIDELQRVAVEESRLGVPLAFGRDVIHGYRTIFPIPLGQAAAWNPDLVEAASAVAAKEARSVGVHWTFAPMLDIARDPRWGRIAEGFGEDPCLVSALAAASVRGFQGDDLTAPDRVAACAKHFVGYGAAEGGRDYNTTVISPSLLHNVYLPPFRAALGAGAATVMCAFNDLNGVPMSGHGPMLRELLRERWGFDGVVVSDWESIREMIPHGAAADGRAAALLAARGGVTVEMASDLYHNHLASLVHSGEVDESMIDDFVREVLRLKFRLGLFDRQQGGVRDDSILMSDEHLELARDAARQSVVLLKNQGGVLPLNGERVKSIAVIGPLADSQREQLGCWIPDGREADSRTPLPAIREAAGADVRVEFVAGLADDLDRRRDGFAEAVAAAERADVAVVFVGERANLSGEARSRASLDLPGAQNELVEAIAATGKPLVLVVQAGRPLTIGRQVEAADAVLFSFHAGTMAGPALADLLWGRESPSGKLPVTIPKSVGQIPLYYNHMSTGRPPRAYNFARDSAVNDAVDLEQGFNSNYLDGGPYPLFPFGYGLSYTTFEYGDVELSTQTVHAGQTLAVRAPVTNAGAIAADEVVQLYVRDVVASLVRPVRELKAFRRVRLEPGETQIVELALAADDLAFYDNDEVRRIEPGQFEIFVGGSSLAPCVGTIELAP
jgi:beta-glucosidase